LLFVLYQGMNSLMPQTAPKKLTGLQPLSARNRGPQEADFCFLG